MPYCLTKSKYWLFLICVSQTVPSDFLLWRLLADVPASEASVLNSDCFITDRKYFSQLSVQSSDLVIEDLILSNINL